VSGHVELRSASVDEADMAADVRASAVTDVIITAEGMRTWLSALPPGSDLLLLAAADATGRLVGWCTAARSTHAADQASGMLDVTVRPEAQGQGVGGRLVAAGLEHLDRLGLHTVRTSSPDGPAQRALARQFGYQVVSESQGWAVDPRTVAPLDVPADVSLVPFGELDDPAPLFELDVEASRDVPGEEDFDALTLDQWVSQFWRSVFADDEASLAGYVDGELAGLTMLRVDRPSGRAQNNLTATRRPHRGRGLARLLKSHSLGAAARAGATIAFTFTDATTAPMLAVNRSLGYRPSSRWLAWERRRAPAS
jgi:GNAT superfamily N-acetyltransferase